MRLLRDESRGSSSDRDYDSRSACVIGLLSSSSGRYSLDQLARHLCVSKSRLEHLFKHETGMSIRTFAVSFRMHRAAALLLEPGVSIKEARCDAGFLHAANFNHLFRRHFGCSPTVYRASVMEGKQKRPNRKQERPTQCACSTGALDLVLSAMPLL